MADNLIEKVKVNLATNWESVNKNIEKITEKRFNTRPLRWAAWDKDPDAIIDTLDKQFIATEPETAQLVEKIRTNCEYISRAMGRATFFSLVSE